MQPALTGIQGKCFEEIAATEQKGKRGSISGTVIDPSTIDGILGSSQGKEIVGTCKTKFKRISFEMEVFFLFLEMIEDNFVSRN